MIVELLSSLSGNRFTAHAHDTIECNAATGKRLIDAGQGIEVASIRDPARHRIYPGYTPESDASTPEGETGTPESVKNTPEGETGTPESVTNTPEGETNAPESVTNTPESVTNTPAPRTAGSRRKKR